ncbi:MAG TPA: histidine phosphatase family protein [Nocardioides sp.]|uniref:histidine phosphatase family protein n=1 Tax=Nocardioides sp. TaxID=35761 RepID=UPI002D7E3FF9|nr:histidine phosphatase family protein [Nocardioides sp.]HET6653104.1 histidine phosphatase family protein [Nocardioides sp.]
MSVLLLVRHGQASWGAEDYDKLSELGEQQATVLGRALRARGGRPDVLVHGRMTRQRETARLLGDAAGWPGWQEDEAWDEMNHEEVLQRQHHTFAGDSPTREEFQAWFEAATDRWTAGRHDHEYTESFSAFGDRVLGALDDLASRLDPSATAVVVTSGGPIARITAELLGGGADLHRRIAPVVVNASVTKVVVGQRGTTLVSFNDHSHLELPSGQLTTYR